MLIEPSTPARERKRKNGPNRKISKHHFIRTRDKNKHLVCAAFFSALFEVGTRRLITIGKGKNDGTGVRDLRGGDRMFGKYGDKRVSVGEFIKNLRVFECHYGRKKTRRLYLPSYLNIKKLLVAYNESVAESLQVKYEIFRKIFVEDFNIGFGSLAVDTCSYCDRMSDLIRYEKKVKKDLEAARKHTRELKLHRSKAKHWFELMKTPNVPNSMTYCFDLQQVHYLPHLSIGEVFYKRQLSYYCFCITDYKIEEPVFYRWLETEAHRGSEEVASALIDFLQSNISKWDTNEVTTIRLFCDGCGGQNKNRHIVHALGLWLDDAGLTLPSLKKIILYFPVRNHSYLPWDRLFGRVEKILKKTKEVLLPEQYNKIYSSIATVKILNKSWKVRRYKDLRDYFRPVTGIQDMKKVAIKKEGRKIAFKMEMNYFQNDASKKYTNITKTKILLRTIIPPRVQEAFIPLPLKKAQDIESILVSRFGEEWKVDRPDISVFYSEILSQAMSSNDDNKEEEDEDQCNCLEDDPVLL